MPARIILIPGMGADHRLFGSISLPGYDVLRTNWIPHRNRERLPDYAERFAERYGILATDTLIGVSMGGIVAGAIARRLRPHRLILISSCTDIRQLSPLITGLSLLGPIAPFEWVRFLPGRWMPAQRKLALAMFAAQDMAFIRWACQAVMAWTGSPRLPGTVTIHGTADRVFPIHRQPQVDGAIAGGGHLMVMDRAAEVASAIVRVLA